MVEKEAFFAVISGVCIGLMGYTHISMYAYMPIVTGLSLIESVRKKKLAYFNIIQALMFGFSIWYAYIISPIYVKRQYYRFTINGKINYFTVFALIDVVVIICVLIQFYTMKRSNKFFCLIRKIMFDNYKKISLLIWGMICIFTVYYAYFMCFTNKFAIKEGVDAGSWNLRSRYINTGMQATSYLNIVNISRAIGVIGMLVFVVIPFFRYNIPNIAKTFYYVSLYGMILFTVLQMDTPFNYYASRYFVPVLIPMIVLSLVCSIKKKNWCIYFIILTILYNHHFWPSFLMGGPKVGQYELLRDALKYIPKGAVVFCDSESHVINSILSGNIRVINDNEVYSSKNIDEVLQFYSSENGYIISESELEIAGELVISKIYLSQYSFGNGNNGRYDTGVGAYQIPLYIYRIEKNL